MPIQSNDNRAPKPIAQELSCDSCGGAFIFRSREQEPYTQRGWTTPKHCPACRAVMRERLRCEAEQQERRKWAQKKAEDKALFEIQLKDWRVVSKDDIRPQNDQVLYIIGNGFDLMHNVRSSYYAFRDSLGKQSRLRYSLEHFLTPEDIWADFEAALAHFNIKAMCGQFAVSDWLDVFDAYDEDSSASDFFLAVEAAANPILTVVNELPHRFRTWVETLSIGTEDRPLLNMFRNGKVLCFNYTEFVETLYGVSKDNVCYIHGCRQKRKYHPKEKLILGHMPGASEKEYAFIDSALAEPKDPHKQYLIDAAQEHVFRLVAESDEELTKHCRDIIAAQELFFSGLNKIEEVIVIGHSFSPVDWDYFSEVASRLPDIKKVHWYFGCHGLRDLDNLKQLLTKLGIERSVVSVFRTDNIVTTPLKGGTPSSLVSAGPVKKMRCTSPDGRWMVKTAGCSLSIVDMSKQETNYETMFSSSISNACFAPSGEYLFAVIRGADPGVFLFRVVDDYWHLVNELESIQHQSVLNSRLNHVYLTAQEISFVYNNRVRNYSLSDGTLVSNYALRNAGNFSYDGEEISRLFLRRR